MWVRNETVAVADDELVERYRQVRDLTEAIAAPLSAEDQVVQSMPDASPVKWHRAHTTWFFETFLLQPNLDGYEVFHETFGYLFNSYYEAVGDRHPRAERGLVTRPDIHEVAAYRRHVDEAMTRLIPRLGERLDLIALVELGLHHEQQHQELALMDLKHAFSCNPLLPAYAPREQRPLAVGRAQGWVNHDGGVVQIGHAGDGFAFDNETPRHSVVVESFRLGDRLVTNGEWMEFIADGGYRDPAGWLSDGWHTVQSQGWHAPLYWSRRDDGWWSLTLSGAQPVDVDEPVCHVSYYEAEAFARWAGARLATEAEWETAAAGQPTVGNLLDSWMLHPTAAPPTDGSVAQMFGDVWEWTASPYVAYPGFRVAPGAVGEYNGKFMVNQMVLRGGCCVTPPGHVRSTYRNFFPPHARWMFSGVRLAADS